MAAKKKRRGGKRPLPPGVGKLHVIGFKVSAAEMALCDELAARHGIERSELMRRALHAAALHPELIAPVRRSSGFGLTEAGGTATPVDHEV